MCDKESAREKEKEQDIVKDSSLNNPEGQETVKGFRNIKENRLAYSG